jgi:hypothetical protein
MIDEKSGIMIARGDIKGRSYRLRELEQAAGGQR